MFLLVAEAGFAPAISSLWDWRGRLDSPTPRELVEAVGFEPTCFLGIRFTVWRFQPLTHTSINLVPQEGIEPPHPAYKTGPLPLRIQGHKNLAALGGNDPHSSGVTSRRASMNTLKPNKDRLLASTQAPKWAVTLSISFILKSVCREILPIRVWVTPLTVFCHRISIANQTLF